MVLWKDKLLNFFIPGTWQRISKETADSVTVLYIKDRFARAMSYRPRFLASNTVRPVTTFCVIRALSISPHCEISFRSSNFKLHVVSQLSSSKPKTKSISQTLTVGCVPSNKTSNIPCSRAETHLQWCLNTSERKNNCFFWRVREVNDIN